MKVDDYLRAARTLLGGRSKPRQVFLRRAVSAAYYALFHELCSVCADQFAGRSRRNSSAWVRAYRSIDHIRAKKELNSPDPTSGLVQQFARTFIKMQEERHEADYDPQPYNRSREEAVRLIEECEFALAALRYAVPAAKEELASRLLFRSR